MYVSANLSLLYLSVLVTCILVWLQKRVRDPRAGYFQSLEVLRAAKECGVYTKSSIMLGLGETHDEIIDTMYDLKDSVRSLAVHFTNSNEMNEFLFMS